MILTYNWFAKNQQYMIAVETKKTAIAIEPGSEAEFITEHYFGYTRFNPEKSFEYEVKHPRWQQFEVLDYKMAVDFENNYGNDFNFLKKLQPVSVIVAEGSAVSVENKKTIR